MLLKLSIFHHKKGLFEKLHVQNGISYLGPQQAMAVFGEGPLSKKQVFFVGGVFIFGFIFSLRGGSGGSLCSPDSASLRPASGERFFCPPGQRLFFRGGLRPGSFQRKKFFL